MTSAAGIRPSWFPDAGPRRVRSRRGPSSGHGFHRVFPVRMLAAEAASIIATTPHTARVNPVSIPGDGTSTDYTTYVELWVVTNVTVPSPL